MRFRVDTMPYYPSECPFCKQYGEWCEMDKTFKDICKLDGYVCKCFKYKDPDPLECRWLIDEETEDELKNKRG